MLDIHFFREHFDEIKAKLATKHFAGDWDAVRTLDAKRLEALKAFETVRARQQAESKTLASLDKALWLTVPNIPDTSVPIGKTSQENREVYQRHPQNEDFSNAVPHYELPNFERGLDFVRGTKVTGAGFPFSGATPQVAYRILERA